MGACSSWHAPRPPCGARGHSARPPCVATELAVMTLNLQYFSSYPEDLEAAKLRLSEVLQGPKPPDVICVQEGLNTKNVLNDVGFELCVCSAQEEKAETVHDMVYGDPNTLKLCDDRTHGHLLCNQIYVRRGTPWTVLDRGCLQTSTSLHLAGGGGRLTGKLAIRSMVWVRLAHHHCPKLSVFVLCTHITGGRFEDQYFVQQLAEERKLQLHRIISFFDGRPDPSKDDVGILVGDFNATSVYTADGPMHGYYKGSIERSGGVQADAGAMGVEGAEALEDLFKAYMVSPFTAVNSHDWTFAYDGKHVGYTSGFGHLIDHMAINRPIRVKSAEVAYLTNQKLGGKPADTRLPLTDHNAVKTVFVVERDTSSDASVFRTEYDFVQHLRQYKALVHVSGFGSFQQYADIDEVAKAISRHLFEGEHSLNNIYGKGHWVACYSGPPLNETAAAEDTPDVAALLQRLRRRYGMRLISIQEYEAKKEECEGVQKHVDAVYYYPPEPKVAWGDGTVAHLVGAAKIVLDVSPLAGLPLYWITAGGCQLTCNDLKSAWERKLAILSVPARARYPQDLNLPEGPCGQFWESLVDYECDAARPFRRKKSSR